MNKPEFYQEDLDLIDALVEDLTVAQKELNDTGELITIDLSSQEWKRRLNHLGTLWFRVEEMVDKSL